MFNLTRHPPILFMHIPKTGGSSVAHAIRRKYRFSHAHAHGPISRQAARLQLGRDTDISQVHELGQQFCIGEILIAALRGKRFLTGHVWFDSSFLGLRDELGFLLVTLLRYPVDRWVSEYFYRCHPFGKHAQITSDFETFAHTREASYMGSVYLQHFLGRRPNLPLNSEELEEAVDNAAAFTIIGNLENLSDFTDSIRAYTNVRLKVGHRRVNPAASNQTFSLLDNAKSRSLVEELCAPDLKLYALLGQRGLI